MGHEFLVSYFDTRHGFRPLFWGFVFNKNFRPGDAVFSYCGFRPLFWGFVFNDIVEMLEYKGWLDEVFVPSSGDLFLIGNWYDDVEDFLRSFRPLFWGFVFNWYQCHYILCPGAAGVFVPSSGDLFLMARDARKFRPGDAMMFSSPLLGICF